MTAGGEPAEPPSASTSSAVHPVVTDEGDTPAPPPVTPASTAPPSAVAATRPLSAPPVPASSTHRLDLTVPWSAEPTKHGIEARTLAMDLKWETIRADWLIEYPDHPLPQQRPTIEQYEAFSQASSSTFPARPSPSSSPSSHNVNALLSRRGISMPRRAVEGGTPRARTPPISYAIGTPLLPSSPLGKISDDQVSYFSGVAESLDGTSPSEGMVIQSPDGKPAIFFQPQKTSRSSSNKERTATGSRPMERDRELPESGGAAEGSGGPIEGTTSFSHPSLPRRTSIAAPHEIGLGQSGRRISGGSSSGSNTGIDSPLLHPIGTPALTLDSFIAKSRGQSEENSSAEGSPNTYNNKPAGLSRQQSSNSNPPITRPSSARPSVSNANASSSGTSPSLLGSPRMGGASATSAHRRTASPPVSPRPELVTNTTNLPISGAQSPTNLSSQPRSARDSDKPSHPPPSRRGSGTTSAHSKRSKARTRTLPTVPPISVLIVEDNIINQKILSRFMGMKGIKYEVAKDGEEAVQKWRAGSFHLVLMDIQLPVKDGIEATREIRDIEKANNVGTLISTPTGGSSDAHSPFSPASSIRSTPTSPLLTMPVIIVALTASSLQVDRVSALAAGCNDFLTKPVSLPWLTQKLLEWGSMAYLSGFSRTNKEKEEAARPSTPGSSPAFSAVLNRRTLVADNISAHLHIERKPGGSRSTSPARPPGAGDGTESPAPLPGNPILAVTSPTPILTPAPIPAAPSVVGARQRARTLDEEDEDLDFDADVDADEGGFSASDLKVVDSRLEDLQSEGLGKRPGPSPLKGAEHSESVGSLDPSLDSVVAEGERLAEIGRKRANSYTTDSFSLVMTESTSRE